MTQGDSFQVERIAALSPLNRIERAAHSADSQNRRRPHPAPDRDETDETDSESDAAPQDVIEWSAALREGLALTVVPSFRASGPVSPSPDSESRRLDLEV